MASVKLQRIGSYLLANDAGFLQGSEPRRGIKGPWSTPVRQLTNAYLREWAPTIHSVYIRGSVARSLAIPAVSDIDSFGVLNAGAVVTDLRRLSSWSEAVYREIEETFPFVAGVEVDLVPFESVLDRSKPYAFIVKSEAACVHGDSLADRLEPFNLSEVNFQTRYFREHLNVFIDEYPSEPAIERPGFVAWLAKRFLRLGMELVMERENRYTRDLYLCYESFARHYPLRAESMYRALELAVDPVANVEVESFLREFGEWLAGEADKKLSSIEEANRYDNSPS